ncbi:hypothetical protein [Streptomyces griseorubiginosus]|uniref:hypothetical protein n=1 Tax=Streptomyces griseorubiginosus TaxID=67304 RepID=UPI00215AD06C|nr:hypothetical protein [Streptomyces griseorubiginosus]
MADTTEWQAFGERVRRGAAAPGRPSFGGFDWQGAGENAAGTSDGAGSAPGGERASVPNPTTRPPIRTPHAEDTGSTPPGTDTTAGAVPMPSGSQAGVGAVPTPSSSRTGAGAVPTPSSSRTGAGAVPTPSGSDTTAGAVPMPSGSQAGVGAVPTQAGAGARSATGGQGAYRPGSPKPGASFSDSAPPPPPASARFPDTPPPPGAGAGRPAPRSTGARTSGPGPMPPESGTGAPSRGAEPTVPGAVPPRPAAPPSVPPTRSGAPAEAASETTFRMRPVPGGRETGEGRTGSPSGASETRTTPSGGPATPPKPTTRPDAAPPLPDTSRTASGPVRPFVDSPRTASGRPTAAASGTGSVRPFVDPRRTGPDRPAADVGRTVSGTGHPSAAPDHTARSATTPPPPAAPPRPSHMPATPPAPAQPPSDQAASAPGPRATPLSPDPALSWSATLPPQAGPPGSGRPVVSFGEPEVGYRERSWLVRIPLRIAAAAGSVVLGLGLIGGAVTGSWLIGDSGEDGGGDRFAQAGELWHSVPVDQLFPPTVDGQGAGPGGADRTWTRIAVAPDSGCTGAFDPLLRKALAPVGCERLLRATYTDATQSYVTTVGLLFTDADATAMRELDRRFTKEGLDKRTDLMPLPYAAKNTLAADFGARQRGSWTISVLTDAPVVAYAVSGWVDGRAVDTPEPAVKAMEPGDTSPAAQAGLGNEAKGLADRVERALRKTVISPSEQPS